MNKNQILDKLKELEFVDEKIKEIGHPVKLSEYIGFISFCLLLILPLPCFFYFSETGDYHPFLFFMGMISTTVGTLFFVALLSLWKEKSFNFYKDDSSYYKRLDKGLISDLNKYIDTNKTHPKNLDGLLAETKSNIQSEFSDKETIELMIEIFKENKDIKDKHKDVLINAVKKYEEKIKEQKEEDKELNETLNKAGFESFEKKKDDKIFKIDEVCEHE